MRFSKYHGTMNDFVLIGDPEGELPLTTELVRAICDRRGGVGADGVIRVVRGPAAARAGLAGPSAAAADFFMDHYNADGGPAEMCGNGIRCLAKFAYDRGLTASDRLDVLSRAGMKHLDLTVEGGAVERVTVDMGAPILDVDLIPMRPSEGGATFVGQPFAAEGRTWIATAVSMGNPHLVLILDAEDPDDVDVERIGPAIERRAEFPNGANIEFVRVLDASTIRMRVWERGVGQTAACGTGACAAVVATGLADLTGPVVEAQLPGGALEIDLSGGDGVLMTGPASWVFDGELSDAWLAAVGAGSAVGAAT